MIREIASNARECHPKIFISQLPTSLVIRINMFVLKLILSWCLPCSVTLYVPIFTK